MNAETIRNCALATLLGGALVATAADARLLGEMATRIGVKRLASGPEADHTCFVMADGTIRCWGSNASGQLGVAGAPGATPVTPTGINTAVSIAVGQAHTCALLASGSVKCWGSNASGQLGIATTTASTSTPTVVPNVARATSIAAGGQHTCARIADGTVSCWGANDKGQLGAGNFSAGRAAAAPVLNLIDAVKVTAGIDHACALRAGGKLACWGGNDAGQLGGGSFVAQNVPREVTGFFFKDITDVSAGRQFTCVIKMQLWNSNFGSNNQFGETAACFGLNEHGGLGQPSPLFSQSPLTLSDTTFPFTEKEGLEEIAAGSGHTCAIHAIGTDRSVMCWGANESGQIGRGTATGLEPPRGQIVNAIEVATGRAHTCSVDARDNVKCWGANALGQLGTGTTGSAVLSPPALAVLSGAVSARGVAAGDAGTGFVAGLGPGHTCAWRADGTASCWGANEFGQLNDSTTTDRRLPTATRFALPVVSMALGRDHSCALAETGTGCWGANDFGQADFLSTSTSIPLNVNSIVEFMRSSSAGMQHTCGLGNGGAAASPLLRICWGRNQAGVLGGFSTANVLGEVFEIKLTASAGGTAHSCFLDVTGTVKCFGSNTKGQLGDPTGASAIPGLVNVVAVAAGGDHACALLVNGQVMCWGDNAQGQVDGSTTPVRPTPVFVPGIAAGDAVGIAVGAAHSCILASNGSIRCWGANARGQLGDGTTTNRSAPVNVTQQKTVLLLGHPVLANLAIDSILGFVAGGSHNCAVRTDGSVLCWGGNARGQLGDNTLVDRTTAVAPASFTANIAGTMKLSDESRTLESTALLNCTVGARFFVEISVTQGTASGAGQATGDCTGGLQSYRIRIEARGRNAFASGDVTGTAQIAVRDHGTIVDEQTWTRAITVVAATAGGREHEVDAD